jgi:hypothetical protein
MINERKLGEKLCERIRRRQEKRGMIMITIIFIFSLKLNSMA